ncbi:MAG TPA: 30S ribosomal protein S6 [Candidatus Paceibacterota bacterium]|nr:30S ribosomal protein S6 [Candidatus Paceibacterota bacterium]
MNKDIEHGTDGTELELGEGYNESRIYELGFHIDPELPQEEVKKVYQGIRETAEKAGSLVAEGEPQRIPLAYTISRMEPSGRRDFNSAYFAWVAYEADGQGHDEMLRLAKEHPALVRYLDVKTDKEAAKHAAEMHEIYAKLGEKEEGQTSEEEVSDVELEAALKDAEI